MMITSAENKPWPEDIVIGDLELAGLPIPSVIRPAKIATIEAAEAEHKGRISSALRREVLAAMKNYSAS